MSASKTTADRIRPILQAMERSIESARRRRLNQDEELPPPPSAQPPPAPPVNGADSGRRKARPKRPTSLLGGDRWIDQG
jgi:hypothetical protein